MREVHHLRSWASFVRRLDAIKRKYPRRLLFRGHSDARWSLATTLERPGQVRMTLDAYYRMIGTRVLPQVESITGQKFDVPRYTELRKLFKEYDKFSLSIPPNGIPGYAYLIYTRHHGFPSPLLDWTRSAYVAAFFAFAAENKRVRRRAICVWRESIFRDRGTNISELHRLGPYVTTHRRHVLQQCDYSVGLRFDTEEEHWQFAPQEEAFAHNDEGSKLHRLWKFTLPSTERPKVLRILDDLNINAYSLFGSEEGLMDTLALRELDLRTAPEPEPTKPEPQKRTQSSRRTTRR